MLIFVFHFPPVIESLPVCLSLLVKSIAESAQKQLLTSLRDRADLQCLIGLCLFPPFLMHLPALSIFSALFKCSVTRLAIYWTLGNFFKPLATIDLPKSLTFLGNFCIGVKSYHFSIEIIFGQLL